MTSVASERSAAEIDGSLYPYYALHRMWLRRAMESGGRAAWVAILGQLYYASRATAPLLLLARERALEVGGRDHIRFAQWCEEHAEEEKDHGDWLLADLATVGEDTKAISSGLAEIEVLELIGTQFMIAHSAEPSGILGYFFVGECHPSDPDLILNTAQRFGLPRSALETVLFHATEDQEHQREVMDQIAAFGSSLQRAAFERSAVAYLSGWTKYFQTLQARVGAL